MGGWLGFGFFCCHRVPSGLGPQAVRPLWADTWVASVAGLLQRPHLVALNVCALPLGTLAGLCWAFIQK